VCAKWERMWGRPDNQEVGLEAAILERVRNSSLVKWSCADNVAGLKRTAEAVSFTRVHSPGLVGLGVVVWMGRGASCVRGSRRVSEWWRVWE
jgi:hypothetical protein